MTHPQWATVGVAGLGLSIANCRFPPRRQRGEEMIHQARYVAIWQVGHTTRRHTARRGREWGCCGVLALPAAASADGSNDAAVVTEQQIVKCCKLVDPGQESDAQSGLINCNYLVHLCVRVCVHLVLFSSWPRPGQGNPHHMQLVRFILWILDLMSRSTTSPSAYANWDKSERCVAFQIIPIGTSQAAQLHLASTHTADIHRSSIRKG